MPRGERQKIASGHAQLPGASASTSTASWLDLEVGLDAALACLKPGGRLAVISFHSLEDRIVKQFMARHAKAPPANRRLPVEAAFTPTLRLVGGAQKAGDAELAANPRARSAVLRVAEKLPDDAAVAA